MTDTGICGCFPLLLTDLAKLGLPNPQRTLWPTYFLCILCQQRFMVRMLPVSSREEELFLFVISGVFKMCI